jgi:hypothetical protein
MKIIASTLIALSLSLASRLRQSPLTEPPSGARRAVRPNKSIVGLRWRHRQPAATGSPQNSASWSGADEQKEGAGRERDGERRRAEIAL